MPRHNGGAREPRRAPAEARLAHDRLAARPLDGASVRLDGYPVRVAFAFGERKTARNVQGLWGIRTWLAARGVPAVVPWLHVFGRSPVRLVVSRTLAVPYAPDPSAALVERWHATVVATLRQVHAEHTASVSGFIESIEKLGLNFGTPFTTCATRFAGGKKNANEAKPQTQWTLCGAISIFRVLRMCEFCNSISMQHRTYEDIASTRVPRHWS